MTVTWGVLQGLLNHSIVFLVVDPCDCSVSGTITIAVGCLGMGSSGPRDCNI